MDIRIDIDKKFDKDLRDFSSQENEIIKKKINVLVDLLRSNQKTSHMFQKIHKVHLIGNLDSSLFILKVNLDIRVILTSEDDPLFSQHILTLIRVVRHKKLDKVFKSLSESLYQSILNKSRGGNG